MKNYRHIFFVFPKITRALGVSFISGLLFCSCGPDDGSMDRGKDSVVTKPIETEKNFQYASQLFKIEPAEFKLHKDDLPFPFSETYLKQKNVRAVRMLMKLKEGRTNFTSEFVWEINRDGQVTKESKMNGRKVENSVEKTYLNGLLNEVNILNPGARFESAIKKVEFFYSNGALSSVNDILENGDTVKTIYDYENGRMKEKKILSENAVKGATRFLYYRGQLSKVEFFNGDPEKDSAKGGIHTYTYTPAGKLLYGDHWYPGVSNDSYIFGFDKENRLQDITCTIFLNTEGVKAPGKTKSYRYEYENNHLKRINYFMQAKAFSQSGTFEFSYDYY